MRGTLSLAVAAFAAAAFPSPAGAKAKPRCPSASNVVAENRVARVFIRPLGYGGKSNRDLFGCWKGDGDVFYLTGSLNGCVATETFKLVRLRGRFVAFYTDGRTTAGCLLPTGTTRSFVHVANVRSKARFLYEIPARPAADRLLLNTKGMVAWPSWLPQNQVEVLIPAGVEDPRRAGDSLVIASYGFGFTVGSGPIHPESVQLSSTGLVSWVSEGVPGAFQIGRDPYPPP